MNKTADLLLLRAVAIMRFAINSIRKIRLCIITKSIDVRLCVARSVV